MYFQSKIDFDSIIDKTISKTTNTLAPIAAVTPQLEVGEFEGFGVGELWSEEYEWRAGNSF